MANEAENLYYGRRPSLGPHGGERGYRSRPGAPMADPTRNVGGASYGPLFGDLTPITNWDRMFRNHITQQTPSSLAAARKAGGNPGMAAPLPDELPEDQQARMGGTPSLQSMAQGGNSHAALWSNPVPRGTVGGTINPLAGTGYETGNIGSILSKYQTPDTTAEYNRGRVSNPGYGWGQSFEDMTNGG